MLRKTIRVSGFPDHVPSEDVKNFLERYTGPGSVIALEVKETRKRTGYFAIVQFKSSHSANIIIELASTRRLYYGTTYLRAFKDDNDIVRDPRSDMHEMGSVTLNFGCQISENKFSVLWKEVNVNVKFGTKLKKMEFLFSFNLEKYKLQLSYKNIWQLVLYHPPDQMAKHLLIQLFGAPRIYQNLKSSKWVRTTDFTSLYVAQSSGLCLELPYSTSLLNFQDNFVYYKESNIPFILEKGIPYCHNNVLAPILHPPRGHDLPFKILFKVCSLVQTGCIPGPKLDVNFYRLVNPERIDIGYIEYALEKLYYRKECCYDPVSWLLEQYDRYRNLREKPKLPTIYLNDGLVYTRRVQVTPTKVYFLGPEVNKSNRVLRHYQDDIDNFLRVSFVDEEWDKMHSTDLSFRVADTNENRRTKISERILSTLREGIKIGDKKFDFLAFSSSQLRDNSLWMYASSFNRDANDIRSWMGDFRSLKNVAKYAARLGQSFGSSTETLSVHTNEIETIPDIEVLRGRTKYIFSDGIGKISADFAWRVAVKCRVKNSIPSAFQIRYGGYKGVVAVDPISSVKLSLRPSMLKYDSDNIKLDVLAWSKYQPCYLNRQIITLLSTLGVEDNVFEKMQREVVAQLDVILDDPSRAQETLDLMSPGENTNILKEILKCGYKHTDEPFLSMMLQTFRSSKLLDLRTKARIFVPQARQMMGCLDETGTLEYGQVFVQISNARSRKFYEKDLLFSDDCTCIIKKKVVVAKNPCLHPGDVRVLEAVDVPALHHMVDCVVFPQKGIRPHPNECSGSDLDGDLYFVCWDRDLIPHKSVEPMDYNPAPSTQLDHDVTIEEVKEYFTNYIANDSLGIISNAHTVFADKEEDMAFSKPCIELGILFSIAVDFPKTGIPADIPSHLRVKEYPDFMDKFDRNTYVSQRVIGKLFREVKDIAPHTLSFNSFSKDTAKKSYDRDMEVDGFKEYVDKAFDYKMEYDYKLGNLMEYYGIKTEAEILSGQIMGISKTFDRRKDKEAIAVAVSSLKNEARSWFKIGNETDDQYAKASAWYHVTYHPDFWGCYNEGLRRDHYISFPWCVYKKLVQNKKNNARRASNVDILESQLRRGWSSMCVLL